MALALAFGVIVTGGTANAQVVVGDPLNASKAFSSYCSACHKSAAGLGKTMGVAGLSSFLRQHYTTGAQMSTAMANYLMTAKNEPRPKPEDARRPGHETAETPGQRKDAARSKQGQDSRVAARTGRNGQEPAATPPAAPQEPAQTPTAPEATTEAKPAPEAPLVDQGSFDAPSP